MDNIGIAVIIIVAWSLIWPGHMGEIAAKMVKGYNTEMESEEDAE
jgi:hypothetical protein